MSLKSTSRNMLIAVIVVVIIAGGLWWVLIKNREPQSRGESSKSSSDASFNKSQYSLTDPASLWMIVNKKNALPAGYVPAGLAVPHVTLRHPNTDPEMSMRPEALKASEELIRAAKSAGIDLMVVSGYRSFDAQKSIYSAAVRQDGKAEAEKYSARAGHSEHQTGLAVDFGLVNRECELQTCLADTPAGKWLGENAHVYGFVLRYPKDKQNIVGYEYEPWHFRFVGQELANEINRSGQTLEEFFGLPPATNY